MATTGRRELKMQPLSGYDPEVGIWLWALQDVRRRYTLRMVEDLDQRTLDWEGPDERENAIGSLLYHIAEGEMGWLFFNLLGQPDLPAHVKPDFPYPSRTPDNRLTPVQEPLDSHLGRLARSRKVFLETVKEMPAAEWRRLRAPEGEDYAVTPEWAVFHLVEHEAGHAFQISSLKRRFARRFGTAG